MNSQEEKTSPSGKHSILYIGPDSGTSRHRAAALRRLGHEVFLVDPWQYVPKLPLIYHWFHHTGAMWLGGIVANRLLANLPARAFDLVFVDGGALVTAPLVRELKKRYGRILNYNVDDPYGKRDGKKWHYYLKAVPHYDLVAVVRECNVPEAFARGAKDVLLVHRSADEVAHARRPLTNEDIEKWSSEVVFIGTWMPERGPFLARLTELGVPLSIYGARWEHAPEWPALKKYWRGPGLYKDEEYSKAIQCAKVCIGLLSIGNRDTCTQRSFEVPYLAGVFCAERTDEHRSLYEEDVEAVFWSTPEECAEKCLELLSDPEWRASLAERGRARCLQNRTINEPVLDQILSRVFRQAESNATPLESAGAKLTTSRQG